MKTQNKNLKTNMDPDFINKIVINNLFYKFEQKIVMKDI